MQPWADTQLLGDLNRDGTLTPADAATLAAADVSGDGQVTTLDALMILQAAGSIEI